MTFNFLEVERILGYSFKNKNILKQAFIRKSYSQEYLCADNEVLEFIGDEALDLVVTRILLQKYSDEGEGFYSSSLSEGELTEYKANIVNKNYLSDAVTRLGLDEFLILGKTDIVISKSMKEDLYEAIIGAIAIDSNWSFDVLIDVVNRTLNIQWILDKLEEIENSVGELQKILNQNGCNAPKYEYFQDQDDDGFFWVCKGKIEELDIEYEDYGTTKKEARQEVARFLLKFIKDEEIFDKNPFYKAVGDADEEKALQQINELVQKKLISEPTYEFVCAHDKNGNPLWGCACTIPELPNQQFINRVTYQNSKRKAQKSAAFQLLRYLINGNTDK